MKQTIVTAFAALSLALAASAGASHNGAVPGKWTQDFDAAKELAAAQNLPLFLNFTGSDWCGWCKLMDRLVFSQKEWKSWAKDKVVLVFIDFPRDESQVPKKYRSRNRKLQEQYGVRGYPTYIVLSPDGTKVLGRLGASREATPASFIEQLSALLPAPEAPESPAGEGAPSEAPAAAAP